MGLGLEFVVLDQRGHRVEILAGGVEIAGDHLQLADAVEQSRHLLPFPFGQGAIAGHQQLDQLPFVVVADRPAVAGSDFAAMKLVLLQRFLLRDADLLELAALPFDLALKIEDGTVCFDHDGLHIAQHLLQPLPLLGHRRVQRGETLLLSLAQTFQMREGQPLKELGILLDGAAEEVARGGHEKRRTLRGPLRQKLGQIAVARLLQLPRHAREDLRVAIKQTLRIAEAREGGRLLRQLLRMKHTVGRQLGLARRPQLLQELLARRRLRGGTEQRRGVEESPHLPGESLVFRSGRGDFATLPEGLAGEGQLQGPPGAVVGVVQRLGETLTVIRNALGQEGDDGDSDLASPAGAGRRAGAIDQFPQRQSGQAQDEVHRGLLSASRLSIATGMRRDADSDEPSLNEPDMISRDFPEIPSRFLLIADESGSL